MGTRGTITGEPCELTLWARSRFHALGFGDEHGRYEAEELAEKVVEIIQANIHEWPIVVATIAMYVVESDDPAEIEGPRTRLVASAREYAKAWRAAADGFWAGPAPGDDEPPNPVEVA